MLWRTPLKIACAIVELVLVYVVDLSFMFRVVVRTESFSDNTMQACLLADGIAPQADMRVPCMLNDRVDNSFWIKYASAIGADPVSV